MDLRIASNQFPLTGTQVARRAAAPRTERA